MTSPEHDDLDQAYAQAHALTDDGRGPAASVRANVLAAALQVAAQAATRVDIAPEVKPTLVPVAAPVSDVARGRLWALNLSSWRVRSGAALCAVLVVGLAAWRFDASRRIGGEMQVASAEIGVTEMKVMAPPPMDLPPPPKNLPAPPMSPSPSYAPAPPVDVAAPSVLAEPAAEAKADRSARDKDLVVAQAEQPYRANSVPAPRADARAGFTSPPAPTIALSDSPGTETLILGRAVPPVTLAAAAPPATGLAEHRPMAAAAPAPAPVAAPAMAAAAAASSSGNVVVAAADAQQRVEVTGSSIRSVGSGAVRDSLESAKKALPAPADKLVASSLRALPTPLHVAAGNDDVDTLRKLLANPATRVDATDAQGRTPLLLAVAAQHVAAVRLLLAAGADPDHADQGGATPRSVARTGANAEIATLLAAPR